MRLGLRVCAREDSEMCVGMDCSSRTGEVGLGLRDGARGDSEGIG